MSWDGNEYERMGDDYIFMWSIKSRIQLGNSINNVNTGLIYSVTVVTFEAGIYHERNNKNLEPFDRNREHDKSKLWRNDRPFSLY